MINKWTEAAKKLRAVMDAAGVFLTDEQALTVPELYRHWDDSTTYELNDRCTYEGILYRCITAHTAQLSWTPPDSPSLWAKVLIPDENVIPDWQQPDSTNPYMKGDEVTHNGKTWISLIDNNVWEPGEYGWELTGV